MDWERLYFNIFDDPKEEEKLQNRNSKNALPYFHGVFIIVCLPTVTSSRLFSLYGF